MVSIAGSIVFNDSKLVPFASVQSNKNNNLDLINQIEEQNQERKLQEILENLEFQVAVLGAPTVGKTSMLNKLVKNSKVCKHHPASVTHTLLCFFRTPRSRATQ